MRRATHPEADLVPEPEGRGPALAEIAEGDYKTPAPLAGVLAHADASAAAPILNALDLIASRVQAKERFERPVRCDSSCPSTNSTNCSRRRSRPKFGRFAELSARLVATLRADLYAPMLETPALKP